jgi:hypothetical protein
MIILKSFLTTFEASAFFEAAGVVAKIDSSLKPWLNLIKLFGA